MEIFFRPDEIFGGFPAGFRPSPVAVKIQDRRAVEPIRCVRSACQGAVSQRLQDAKGLFSCLCPETLRTGSRGLKTFT
jgi:hypothetical protein